DSVYLRVHTKIFWIKNAKLWFLVSLLLFYHVKTKNKKIIKINKLTNHQSYKFHYLKLFIS
ncbi:hypothetical protein EGB07_22840, partial [Salmonella enterica]|nr:hypothetical protein [Salmonella enterica]